MEVAKQGDVVRSGVLGGVGATLRPSNFAARTAGTVSPVNRRLYRRLAAVPKAERPAPLRRRDVEWRAACWAYVNSGIYLSVVLGAAVTFLVVQAVSGAIGWPSLAIIDIGGLAYWLGLFAIMARWARSRPDLSDPVS